MAEELVFKALQLGTDSGQPDTNVFFGVQLMASNLQKGTLIEVVPLIEQMATGITENLYAVNAALVLALADGNRTDEVRQLLEEEIVGTGFTFLVDALWSIPMCGFAEGAIEVGDPRFARPLTSWRRGPTSGARPGSSLTVRLVTTSVDSPPSSVASMRQTLTLPRLRS